MLDKALSAYLDAKRNRAAKGKPITTPGPYLHTVFAQRFTPSLLAANLLTRDCPNPRGAPHPITLRNTPSAHRRAPVPPATAPRPIRRNHGQAGRSLSARFSGF